MSNIRVRFAPSPTGPLHIGGVRTALYNYLFAKKMGGTFILRIEDTDQGRYVAGAEDYIIDSLKWFGLLPTEGPGIGGEHGPYRQSERKAMYGQYALQLVENGKAYFAFDTPEELDAKRQSEREKGNHNFRYDNVTRNEMKNSLTLSKEEVSRRLENGDAYTIRLNVPKDETVTFTDLVRGEVSFQTNELDDKVLLKADGMPTYHLANIVDDHLMEISHVIRGEEWLPSTAHHILLYQSFGWEDTRPQFAHLPLILKPVGNGKLSKRDGAKFNMPVFPLKWDAEKEEESFLGFREFGFIPAAAINFLAFLGWNPGTEQEIFSLDELCEAFSIENIGKSGARFDYDKAKWFNQQYIQATETKALGKMAMPFIAEKGFGTSEAYIASVCDLMRDRAVLLTDFAETGAYFFEEVQNYDDQNIVKRWDDDTKAAFNKTIDLVANMPEFDADSLESTIKSFIKDNGLKMGKIFPLIRIALAGTMKGPDVFKMIALLGRPGTIGRLRKAVEYFDTV
ncbi:MAG: glutamate--tRNA ligase [Bacteroidota bacterium]